MSKLINILHVKQYFVGKNNIDVILQEISTLRLYFCFGNGFKIFFDIFLVSLQSVCSGKRDALHNFIT